MPLYKGWSTALYTSFLPSTIYFFIYETLTKMMQERLDRSPTWHQYKLGFPFLISCVSELAALSVMVPFETVRTRIQVSSAAIVRSRILDMTTAECSTLCERSPARKAFSGFTVRAIYLWCTCYCIPAYSSRCTKRSDTTLNTPST